MINKRYKIVLDLIRQELSNVETLVQNDINSNEFEINIFENGSKYNIDSGNKVEIACKKSDGTVVVDEVQFIDNIITWTLSKQVLTASGYVEAEVRILENENILTASQSFKFLVRPNLINDDTIKSTSQYRALDEALKKAKEIIEQTKTLPEEAKKIRDIIESAETLLENKQKELEAGVDTSNKLLKETKEYLSGVSAEIEKLKSKEVDIARLKELLTKVDDLKLRLVNLEKTVETANTTDDNLRRSISTATQTKTNLDQSISSAGTSKTNLDRSIDATKKVKVDLDGSIKTGREVKSALDATIETGQNTNTAGMQIKQGLDDSISKANTQKSDLDRSIAKVPQNIASINNAINTVDERLQTTIKTAETKEGELKSTVGSANETDTKAQATMSELKSLLDKSSTSEQALKEIIASGNLDKYVTDPKLQQVLSEYVKSATLSNYATKSELESIDVTGQLTDYAKTVDVDSKLDNKVDKSQITSNYNTIDINTIPNSKALIDLANSFGEVMNKKVDKVSGKTLSSNNYTNADKAKVDAIPTNPKYTDTTYDLSPYAKTTDLRSYAKTADVDTKLNNKVDKVSGKGLSTNDFTNQYKQWVDTSFKPIDYPDTPSEVEELFIRKTDTKNGICLVGWSEVEAKEAGSSNIDFMKRLPFCSKTDSLISGFLIAMEESEGSFRLFVDLNSENDDRSIYWAFFLNKEGVIIPWQKLGAAEVIEATNEEVRAIWAS